MNATERKKERNRTTLLPSILYLLVRKIVYIFKCKINNSSDFDNKYRKRILLDDCTQTSYVDNTVCNGITGR